MKPLALTFGEPAGIGPDITFAAWRQRNERNLPPFYVIADPAYLAQRAKRLGLQVPIAQVTPQEAAAAFEKSLPVAPLTETAQAEPGRPDAGSAPAAIASIRRAVADVMAGHCAAIVTNPVAKNVLYGSGFTDPGHTEFLAKLSQEIGGKPAQPVMLLWARELAVVPVTIHIPLAEVPKKLTRDLIVRTGRIVAHDLTTKFGIAKPRLALAGLNPHAGESGSLGDEERTVIEPAVKELVAAGIDARGPFPADTMFHESARAGYDAAPFLQEVLSYLRPKMLVFLK